MRSQCAAILLCGVAFAACEPVTGPKSMAPRPNFAKAGRTTAWVTNASMPSPREGTCQASVGDRIFVTNGFGPRGDSRSNQIYDIASNSWSAGADASTIRSEGVGVAHGGLVYCIGGRRGAVLHTVEVYDPVTNTWSFRAPMPTARAGLAAAVVGGRIYAIGGRNGSVPRSGTPLAVNEVFDPTTNSWSTAAPMPTARGDLAAAARGDKIYVVGGWNPSVCTGSGGTCNTVKIYDVASDSWSTGASMPTARSSLAAAVQGNTLFAIAGVTRFAAFVGTNESYDIAANTWASAATKPTPTGETFGVSHGGQIFVVGGGFFGVGAAPVPGAVNESFAPQPTP